MARACPRSDIDEATQVPFEPESGEWFALQVRSGRELTSARELRTRQYDVFLPCYRSPRRWSDRIKIIERALFPGYLFCRSSAQMIGDVMAINGVIAVVGVGSRPMPVPIADIDAIRRLVSTRLNVEPWPFHRVGERVRIETGPLRGMQGTVIAVRNVHKLVVSIPFLQRFVAVEIEPSSLSVDPAVLIARSPYPDDEDDSSRLLGVRHG